MVIPFLLIKCIMTVGVVIITIDELVTANQIMFLDEALPERIKLAGIGKLCIEIPAYNHFVVRMITDNFI